MKAVQAWESQPQKPGDARTAGESSQLLNRPFKHHQRDASRWIKESHLVKEGLGVETTGNPQRVDK